MRFILLQSGCGRNWASVGMQYRFHIWFLFFMNNAVRAKSVYDATWTRPFSLLFWLFGWGLLLSIWVDLDVFRMEYLLKTFESESLFFKIFQDCRYLGFWRSSEFELVEQWIWNIVLRWFIHLNLKIYFTSEMIESGWLIYAYLSKTLTFITYLYKKSISKSSRQIVLIDWSK